LKLVDTQTGPEGKTGRDHRGFLSHRGFAFGRRTNRNCRRCGSDRVVRHAHRTSEVTLSVRAAPKAKEAAPRTTKTTVRGARGRYCCSARRNRLGPTVKQYLNAASRCEQGHAGKVAELSLLRRGLVSLPSCHRIIVGAGGASQICCVPNVCQLRQNQPN
jgi:hypothetical protein